MKPAFLMAALLFAASAAQAQDTTPTFSALLAKIESQGYAITSAEREGQQIEVEAITAGGQSVELRIDATTGDILQEQPDD